MKVFLGADHRGFELKKGLIGRLENEGYETVDMGDLRNDPDDDYVDFAKRVAESVVDEPQARGILICGSGAGVDMVANKVDGVRSALVTDVARAVQARQHEDANVVSLPADMVDEQLAWNIIVAFLNTPFSEDERHIRRLEKMSQVEEEN